MKASRSPWLGRFGRQVARDVTLHVTLTVLGALLLFMAVDTVETGNMAKNAEDTWRVLELELTSLPLVFQQVAGLCVLVGTCTALGGLVRRGEVVAMLAAGGPPSVVLKPALLCGILWAVALALLTETVVPEAHARVTQLRRQLGLPTRTETYGQQAWFRGRDRIFRVRALEDTEGRALADVLMLRIVDGRLEERWDVRQLAFADGVWTARDALHRRFEGEDGLRTARHASLELALAERPEDFVQSVGAPPRLRFAALSRAIAARDRLGQPATAHTLELYRRILQPWVLLAGLAGAAGLMLRIGRRPTVAKALGTGVGLGFSLWVFDEVSVALAGTRTLPPSLGAALPALLATVFAGLAWLAAYRRGITD